MWRKDAFLWEAIQFLPSVSLNKPLEMSKNVNSVSVQDDNMTVDCINSAEGGI
jgi:hypothetical protein